MKAGEFRLIPLGVGMKLPKGYEAHIVPRSSTFKNFGIIQTNHMGVIDESYCGPNDWFFMPAYALRDTVIHKNDRICQFRIQKHQPEIVFEEVERLEDVMGDLDILYMTRVQRERFFNEEDYVRMKDFYILDKSKMDLAKPDMLVLHPLPRVNEISVEVDNDPRAAYFKQAQYGVYARMALILTLLGIEVQ